MPLKVVMSGNGDLGNNKIAIYFSKPLNSVPHFFSTKNSLLIGCISVFSEAAGFLLTFSV